MQELIWLHGIKEHFQRECLVSAGYHMIIMTRFTLFSIQLTQQNFEDSGCMDRSLVMIISIISSAPGSIESIPTSTRKLKPISCGSVTQLSGEHRVQAPLNLMGVV